ncbi:hypothetical protein OG496_40980 [Streptomyces sp. NBC_00988]|uniref:hypothetical protein n=1 Tax=Streptomyces sp. NBC_00988 TaxID=2903704 RepID=UPI003867CF92|nr:hypothetical protein OG496_40980 [Streptomyces sp. NBC_00988]
MIHSRPARTRARTPVNRRFAVLWLLVLLGLMSLADAGSAAAHGISQNADLELAATFGGNELTFALRQVPRVPGPFQVDVIAHDPVRAATLTLSLVPLEGAPPSTPSRAVIRLRAGRPGSSPTTLTADRTGPWELDVSNGTDTARLPFRVLTPRAAPWEKVVYPAFLVAGVLLLGVLAASVLHRRGAALLMSGGTVVTLTVALTAALLSPDMTAASPNGAPDEKLLTNVDGTTANGRSFTDLALRTVPARPTAGSVFALHLGLTDGSDGQPVDDLAVHHGALAHTVVTSADLKYFAHLHPVPDGPGDLLLRLSLPRPGRYLVQTEIDRVDSGSQLLTATLDLGVHIGSPDGTSAVPSVDTPRESRVTLSPARPTAGVATEISLHVGTSAAPARDLQGWLGMAGHMIVRRRDDDFFGHAHETSSMAALSAPGAIVPDETVGQYGPLLHFVFAFPRAGRYQVWIQYERDFRIHTAAFTVDVTGDTP